MAEKKKSPSAARSRAKSPADEAGEGSTASVRTAATEAGVPAVEAAAAKPRARKAKAADAASVDAGAAEPIARPAPSKEAIKQRAYEIFRERGGSSFDNWIAAERELST